MQQDRTIPADHLNPSMGFHSFIDIPYTKFHVPVLRPNVLDRKDLTEVLEQGLYRKLTVLCAPAGFGKTTLVAQFLGGVARRSVWISLDSRDDDPIRLCRVLAAAFSLYFPKEFGERWATLDWSSPSHELFLSNLIYWLAQDATPFLLILDDWHEVQSELCQRVVEELIERCPAHGHVLVTTRHRPQWPLHRWRARDWVQEYSADTLRFSRDEVHDFFHNTMRVPLSSEDCSLLQQRTEGWVVGLQLVGLSLQHYPLACLQTEVLSSDNQYLAEYLEREVLQRLSLEDREFLLQVSILRRLCGGLCDHLTGQGQSLQRLRRMEQNNLFVSAMNPAGSWFGLHPLWAEFLRGELFRIWPERVSELHVRASRWWLDNHNREEAMEHALAAQAWDWCLTLLHPYVEELLFRQEFSRVQALVRRFPDAVRREHPSLGIVWLWAGLGLGEWDGGMEQELIILVGKGVVSPENRALLLERPPFSSRIERDALRQSEQSQSQSQVWQENPDTTHEAELLFLCANLAALRGDFATSLVYAEQAFGLLPSHRVYLRFTLLVMLSRDPFWLATQESSDVWFEQVLKTLEPYLFSAEQQLFFQHRKQVFQSWLKYHRGQLREAIADLEDYKNRIVLQNESYLHRETSVVLAYFYWERGALEQALSCVQLAEQSFDAEESDGIAIGFYQTAALVYHGVGERDKAYAVLQRARSQRIKPSVQEAHLLEQTELYLRSLEGDLPYLIAWVRRSGISVGDDVDLVREEKQVEYLILAWVLFVEQRWEELETLLVRMTSQLHVASQVPLAITMEVSWALFREVQGQRVLALTHVRQALGLASAGMYLSAFVAQEELLGDLLCELLQAPELLGDVCSSTFLVQLRDALPSLRDKLSAGTPPNVRGQHRILASGQSVALSKREIEILAVVAEGQTYRDIAQKLHISSETVKQHVKNIFQKLQVKNRTQALAKARSLRLLSSVDS